MRGVQTALNRHAELLAEEGWHGVSDLPEGCGRRAGEPVPIGESLDPGRLPNSESTGVPWVDVPVAVFGDVRGDRATQPILVKSLVLVVEDIGSIATQFFG